MPGKAPARGLGTGARAGAHRREQHWTQATGEALDAAVQLAGSLELEDDGRQAAVAPPEQAQAGKPGAGACPAQDASVQPLRKARLPERTRDLTGWQAAHSEPLFATSADNARDSSPELEEPRSCPAPHATEATAPCSSATRQQESGNQGFNDESLSPREPASTAEEADAGQRASDAAAMPAEADAAQPSTAASLSKEDCVQPRVRRQRRRATAVEQVRARGNEPDAETPPAAARNAAAPPPADAAAQQDKERNPASVRQKRCRATLVEDARDRANERDAEAPQVAAPDAEAPPPADAAAQKGLERNLASVHQKRRRAKPAEEAFARADDGPDLEAPAVAARDAEAPPPADAAAQQAAAERNPARPRRQLHLAMPVEVTFARADDDPDEVAPAVAAPDAAPAPPADAALKEAAERNPGRPRCQRHRAMLGEEPVARADDDPDADAPAVAAPDAEAPPPADAAAQQEEAERNSARLRNQRFRAMLVEDARERAADEGEAPAPEARTWLCASARQQRRKEQARLRQQRRRARLADEARERQAEAGPDAPVPPPPPSPGERRQRQRDLGRLRQQRRRARLSEDAREREREAARQRMRAFRSAREESAEAALLTRVQAGTFFGTRRGDEGAEQPPAAMNA